MSRSLSTSPITVSPSKKKLKLNTVNSDKVIDNKISLNFQKLNLEKYKIENMDIINYLF